MRGETMKLMKRTLAFFMAIVMVVGGLVFYKAQQDVDAAEAVTSMDYYDNANGPVVTETGVAPVDFGIVMPRMNGEALNQTNFKLFEGDVEVLVKQANGTGGEWKLINLVKSFVFNDTWGWEYQQWTADAGGWIFWMKLEETTEVRFHGKTNDVKLDYTFELNSLPKMKVTSISTSEGTINADATGTSATHWGQWTFNNGEATYDQVKDDITILVDNHDGKGFVNLMGNANSGFVWDNNFGIYTEGTGGLWFKGIDRSFTIRLQKKGDSSVHCDAQVNYQVANRDTYNLTAYDGKTDYDARDDAKGAVGFPLPKIGGTEVIRNDLNLFVYEVNVKGEWIQLNDIAASGFVYQGNGANKNSDSQQWGYFVDHVYGLWFQPIKKDTQIRIGYPKNGKPGGSIGDNYVVYNITGNPDVESTKSADMNIMLDVDDNDNSSGFVPSGYKMIWNDEFDGDVLDTNKWNYEEGFLLKEDDINTAGWGNNEMEFYSKNNVSLEDGKLKIDLKKETKEFSQKGDPSKKATAFYSSGKINTKNNFSVKYGRVDVRAKFPSGSGIWPAVWMLPNDNVYGEWAYSGEIDIAEGRGRVPEKIFGAMHYGAAWPDNLNTSDLLDIAENGVKKTDTTDWHVYTVVWENNNVKIYCDGYCYFKCTNSEWKSNSDMGNAYAPFDQRFYLILNLACGGSFDNYHSPGGDFKGANMLVDYVRVYQRKVDADANEYPDTNPNIKTDGANDNLYGDYKLKDGKTEPVTTRRPVTTAAPATTAPQKTVDNNGALINQIKTSKVAVKKATKKKSAKKVKVTLKKTVANADGYQVAFYKTKKNAKKNKKALVKKLYKKNKKSFNISHKKLKKKKTLFVRVRAFKTIAGSKYYGKWSSVKKVK